MSGQIYVISGPSGAGKSTIIRLVRERVTGLGYSVSHTSRKPRMNEEDGVHYHFVSRETFRRMIEDGDFVEWAEVYHDLYGTSSSGLRDQVARGVDVVMDLDSQGAKNIKERVEDCTLIYVLPPSLDILEKRLRERATDEEEVITARIQEAIKELRNCFWYDYLVINDEVGKAAEEVASIIISRPCLRSFMLPKVKKLLGE
ncbi:MAG: guanylate kinase [Pseudomonadota bacterium]